MNAVSNRKRVTGVFIVFFFSILNLGIHSLHHEHCFSPVASGGFHHAECACHCIHNNCLSGDDQDPSLRTVHAGVPGRCPACDLLRNFNVPGVSAFPAPQSLGVQPEKTHQQNEAIPASPFPISLTARSPPAPSPTVVS